MTVDRCLASLKPLTTAERKVGYKKSALRQLFGTQRVSLPLSFSRKDFFQCSAKSALGMSISGLQQKLSLRLDEKTGLLAPASQGGEYILKPSPEQYPHAAENEHAGMMASRLMDIQTAECGLVAFSDGELAYLTRRFDRLPGGVKVHQEDLLQIGGLQPDRKYDPTYEAAGAIIHMATNGKRVALRDLFKRVLLSFVIGNNDLHMKNLSLQKAQGQRGQYFDHLSPSYDVLFVQAIPALKEGTFLACGLLRDPDDDDEFFTSAFERYGYYTGYDFTEFGRRLELPEKLVRSLLLEQISKKDDLLALIDNSYMPAAMKGEARALVSDRIAMIATGVL